MGIVCQRVADGVWRRDSVLILLFSVRLINQCRIRRLDVETMPSSNRFAPDADWNDRPETPRTSLRRPTASIRESSIRHGHTSPSRSSCFFCSTCFVDECVKYVQLPVALHGILTSSSSGYSDHRRNTAYFGSYCAVTSSKGMFS